jgi:hypothetical protein
MRRRDTKKDTAVTRLHEDAVRFTFLKGQTPAVWGYLLSLARNKVRNFEFNQS